MDGRWREGESTPRRRFRHLHQRVGPRKAARGYHRPAIDAKQRRKRVAGSRWLPSGRRRGEHAQESRHAALGVAAARERARRRGAGTGAGRGGAAVCRQRGVRFLPRRRRDSARHDAARQVGLRRALRHTAARPATVPGRPRARTPTTRSCSRDSTGGGRPSSRRSAAPATTPASSSSSGTAAAHEARGLACTSCHSVHSPQSETAQLRSATARSSASPATRTCAPRPGRPRTTRSARARSPAPTATTRTAPARPS